MPRFATLIDATGREPWRRGRRSMGRDLRGYRKARFSGCSTRSKAQARAPLRDLARTGALPAKLASGARGDRWRPMPLPRCWIACKRTCSRPPSVWMLRTTDRQRLVTTDFYDALLTNNILPELVPLYAQAAQLTGVVRRMCLLASIHSSSWRQVCLHALPGDPAGSQSQSRDTRTSRCPFIRAGGARGGLAITELREQVDDR